uniref:Putative WRKY transcription factor 19 n=1 Tax=Noccaea caerulescens TaxID=107243 RepID=A0A1J3GLG0_NOCCA
MVDSRPISMSDDVINRMEERMREKIERADMVNQLKDMKIPMLNIDCYRKISKKDKTCYYDRFKTHTASPFSRDYLDVWIHKNELDNYWKSVVTEIERMPEEETLILKSLFIYSGTMYRRMIEPLDIAEYYLSGREEYRTLGRSHHYVMLEKWFGNELIKSGGSDLSDLLTFDSCFWAEVEEAMIVLNLLKTQKLMRDKVLTRKLACFEEYVWEMIRKREVSSEIFLEKSSFMRWWKEYKEIKGRDGFDSSPSDFTEFMNTRKYESYGLLEDRTGDSLKSFVDEKDKGHKMLVVVLKIHLRNEKEKHKALLTISKIAGVISVSLNGYQRITVIGTMDPVVIVNKLRKYWRVIINSVATKEKIQQKKENSKELSEKQVETSDKGKDGKSVLSGDSGSGSIIATVTSKSIHTALNMSNPNDDWSSFCEFLGTHLPPLNLSDCRAEDVIDFLRIQQASGDVEALVGHLSATCEAYGIKLKENPFRSLAVARFLKEVTRESQCILVFWCNDSHDVDESRFMENISEELHKREVTPLMYNLSGREDLDTELLDRSSVGIVVLSNSHACSSESLDHLVAIMEHWKAQDFVYFKETHSDTGLEGREEAVQLQYLNPIQADRVHNWKAAMAEIASIYGHERTEGTQVMLAKEVVRNACIRLDLKKSKNVARILAFLNKSQPSDAEIVGLWGMAGIGKTSIAREIYGILAPQYDLCYFLEDFYLTCQKKGLRQMRDDFFSKVFGEISLSISACDIKPSFMRDWSHSKTILVVLDGVNYARDAEAVIGGFGWFSHGHRIILTSRRKQVLLQCKVKEPYEIQSLWEFESFRLCKQYLNGESEVISELMSCSSGIPLSLEVFGSSLSKEHINNMKEHLQWLRRNPPTKIQEAFQRSFSGLDENEKNIFLDLACFFRGENKDDVVQILDACGFFTYLGICELIDESLISLVDNRIEIPIPFQDIGRFIVNEEDKDPCERSRLWDSNDIADVLSKNSGTEAIEGIFMDACDLTCALSPTVFSNMHGLRLLKFYCSTSGNECKLNLPQGLDTLPDELRLLHWEYYPLKYLPKKFDPENLVEVNMPYSKMEKLWEGKKNLGKLKKIKLSHSRKLTDIMMLSEAMNLEQIDLEGCTSLVDVSTSIPLSGKVVSLNMKDCSSLRTLPAMVGLTSLKLLSLTDCSELEEIQDFAPNLKQLYLAGTLIRELPLSIENIGQLVTLDLENCRRLQHLPFGIRNSRSIVELKLSGCTSLKRIRAFQNLRP